LFWIISVLLFLLAAMFVIVPMLRHGPAPVAGQRERNVANLNIYQERLAELNAELAENHIDQQQFEALEAELSRTLLADMTDDEDVGTEQVASTAAAGSSRGNWLSPTRLVPLLLVVAILPGSVYFYDLWGFRNDLRVAELFQQSRAAQDDPEKIRDLIFDLGAVIERDQENGWAWYFMARNLVALGQFEQAALAFDRAARSIEHPQDQATVLGQYAQAQYIASGQQMTEAVEAIITRAQRLNPSEPAVLQLLGADAFVNEDFQSAITYWQQLLSMSPGGEDAEFLRMVIAQAREGLASSGAQTPQEPALGGPQLEVSLALAPELDLPAQTRVFVSAQDNARPGPPLAARLLTVADLPLIVRLSDADAVGPFNLSSASDVVVVATVSLGGTADVQSGDYQVRSQMISLPADGEQDTPVRLQLLISEQVP
tara:strand:+ start:35087 stop:36373 length:1287 start_codon:yes stop_codon:yes gene_type:complete